MRTPILVATALLFVSLAAPVARAEDDLPTSVIKSAGAKGGELAAKALAGLLYDTSCKDVNTDKFLGYVCQILGSASGRAEDEWKDNVTKQLKEISTKLETIEQGQNAIHRELTTQHQVVEARFDQVSSSVVAGTHLVRIEGLWEKYVAQFDKVDDDVTRDSMLSFAKEIMKSEPHTILADLNVVLTKPILSGQPLLRYPFYEWRLKSPVIPVDRLNAADLYDFAEKKFVDFRTREEKAYVMYLWAAAVLESQCKLHPQQCSAPPRSTADFKADYDRYTRQQVETFNAAVDWLLLSYSFTHSTVNGDVLPGGAKGILLRANILTALTLSSNEGLWGRVIAMGNAWDGSLQVTCNGATQTLTPVLKYSTPVGGSGSGFSGPDSGPVDWWVSSKGNSTYDEVHFANDWQIYHYSLPTATAGPCTVSQNLPKGGYMPWVQPGAEVVTVRTADNRSFPFGSFLAIQRAGGNYALVNGEKWEGTMAPSKSETGKGNRVKVVYDWFVEPDHPQGPWIGLYMKGRAEYRGFPVGSSRIRNFNKIELSQPTRRIRFPEDSEVKFVYVPGNCKGELCNGDLCRSQPFSAILSYDIENNDTEAKKGKLSALAAVCFDDRTIDALECSGGMAISKSYSKAGEREQGTVCGEQTGEIRARPERRYQLKYVISFDLETEGRYTNASEYMYRALLAPGSMYLTK